MISAAPTAVVNHQVVQVPTTTAYQPAPTDHPAKRFKNAFMNIGVLLLIAGVASIILGGVGLSLVYDYYVTYVGSGLWGGAWFIASGGLSVATATRPNSCNVIGGLVVSILTSIVAFSVGIVEAVLSTSCNQPFYVTLSCSATYKGIHGTLACLAFAACVLAIVHSSFCCCGTCGHSNYQGSVVTATTVTTVPTGQVPFQPAYMPGQPYPVQAYYPQGQPAAYPIQSGVVQPAPTFAPAPTASQGVMPPQIQPPYAPPPYEHGKSAMQ